jgi:hypothetical protein
LSLPFIEIECNVASDALTSSVIFGATETGVVGNANATAFHLSDLPTFVHTKEVFLPFTEDVLTVPTLLHDCPADAASAGLESVTIRMLASVAILDMRVIAKRYPK